MWRFRIIGLLAALLPGAAWAQATVNANTGTTTTSGCPTGVSQCFVQNSASSPTYVSITAAGAIAPAVSTSLEATHVLKNAAGTLFSAYASNLTGGTSSNLLIINATSAPVDGAVTPLVCVPFAGGVASANYSGIPAALFSTGITAVISSATSCFTKTTGVTTGFISGIVQ